MSYPKSYPMSYVLSHHSHIMEIYAALMKSPAITLYILSHVLPDVLFHVLSQVLSHVLS